MANKTNPLLGSNRDAIFAAALAFAGKGSRIVDPGCPLTAYGNMVEIGVARGHGRNARVRLVAVNVETHAAFAVA